MTIVLRHFRLSCACNCPALLLQDMVCTREAPLAERVLGVLEVLLHGQRQSITDFCTSLRPALLQALQRINVENRAHGLGQGHTSTGMRFTQAQSTGVAET